MKRERRHELHVNILAKWLADLAAVVKPRANTISTVVLLVFVVFAAVTLWRRHTSSGAEQAWDAFNDAIVKASPDPMFGRPAAPATFEKLAEEYSHTEVASWAALAAADLYLQQGCELILRDKGTANQELQKALENYTSVLSQTSVDPLREQATFGLARTYEALSGTRRAENELQKAIDSYGNVVKNWPRGAYAVLASRRLDGLRLPDTKRFYDKLANYDPKPIFADTPGSAGPGFNLGTVPPEPDAKSKDAKPAAPVSKAPAVPKSSPPPATPGKASEPPPAPKATPAAKTTPAPSTDKPAPPAPAKAK